MSSKKLHNRIKELDPDGQYDEWVNMESGEIPVSVLLGISNDLQLSPKERNWMLLGGEPKPASIEERKAEKKRGKRRMSLRGWLSFFGNACLGR